MKFLQNLFKKLGEKPLWLILAVALLLRLLYLALNYPLWWDSHVYLGMGKFLFSGGKMGMWEPFRPLIHPMLLGAVWKAGLDAIIVGKLFDLIFSLISVFLVYRIAEKVYSSRAAIIAGMAFAAAPVFIQFIGLILTEPLAILFGLLGIYFFIQENSSLKLYWSGIFLGLSFLTKFPLGILFGAALLVIFLSKNNTLQEETLRSKTTKAAIITFGFFTAVIPYLIFNYTLYHDVFYPFISGSWIITTSTWKYGSGWSYYLNWFFLVNPLFIFTLPAVIWWIKNKDWNDSRKSVNIITGILILAYFWQLERKEVRYLVLALPFLSITIGGYLDNLYHLTVMRAKRILKPSGFWILIIILLLLPLPDGFNLDRPPTFEKEIRKIVAEHNITGMVLTSDPAFVSFLENPIITLDGMEFASTIYARQRNRYKLLFLGDCDLGCPPQDNVCYIRKKQFLGQILQENNPEFTSQYKDCIYMILTPKT
jgi:hypothetical protein